MLSFHSILNAVEHEGASYHNYSFPNIIPNLNFVLNCTKLHVVEAAVLHVQGWDKESTHVII